MSILMAFKVTKRTVNQSYSSISSMFVTLCVLCKSHVYHSMTGIARLQSGINKAKLYLAVLTQVHSLAPLLLLGNTSQQHVCCYTLCIMQIPCLPLHDWHRKTAKWDKQSQTVPGSPDSSSLTRTPTTTGKYFTTTCLLLHFVYYANPMFTTP